MPLNKLLRRKESRSPTNMTSGDSWVHELVLEAILQGRKPAVYPRILAGERACPPEDCGGVWGYEQFLEAIRNPKT
ncbi:MAG: plasmid pRiA4b ORF-3 family protein [bacterium]|nr:plasmid pRiA4b ORF-3 family protein [bacterium]